MSCRTVRLTKTRNRVPALYLALEPLVALLVGRHETPQLTPQQSEGQHFYQIRCAHCHEENDLALKPAPHR